MKQEFIDYELHLQMFIEAGADAHARYEVGEPKKPEGYDEYKKAEKEKVFQAYENELATFLRLNAEKSVTNGAIKPKKPEGYDTYIKEAILQTFKDYDLKLIKYHRAIDNNEKDIPEEPKKPEGYDEYVENYIKQRLDIGHFTEEVDITKGLLFDAEGIPQYLSADDHYNGIENPEWTKKHQKKEEKPYLREEETNQEKKEEVVVYNRYAGIEKYLSESDFKNDIINPEWIKKKIYHGGWHNFDEDGIPEYLNADDRYNGNVNPEWLKKHENEKENNEIENPALIKKKKIGGWHNSDQDGIPQFLHYADYSDGIVNPEWLKKHEPDLWLKLYGK